MVRMILMVLILIVLSPVVLRSRRLTKVRMLFRRMAAGIIVLVPFTLILIVRIITLFVLLR